MSRDVKEEGGGGGDYWGLDEIQMTLRPRKGTNFLSAPNMSLGELE